MNWKDKDKDKVFIPDIYIYIYIRNRSYLLENRAIYITSHATSHNFPRLIDVVCNLCNQNYTGKRRSGVEESKQHFARLDSNFQTVNSDHGYVRLSRFISIKFTSDSVASLLD